MITVPIYENNPTLPENFINIDIKKPNINGFIFNNKQYNPFNKSQDYGNILDYETRYNTTNKYTFTSALNDIHKFSIHKVILNNIDINDNIFIRLYINDHLFNLIKTNTIDNKFSEFCSNDIITYDTPISIDKLSIKFDLNYNNFISDKYYISTIDIHNNLITITLDSFFTCYKIGDNISFKNINHTNMDTTLLTFLNTGIHNIVDITYINTYSKQIIINSYIDSFNDTVEYPVRTDSYSYDKSTAYLINNSLYNLIIFKYS